MSTTTTQHTSTKSTATSQPTPAPQPVQQFPTFTRKPVSALKIKLVEPMSVESPTAALLIPDDDTMGAVEVTIAFMQEFRPVVAPGYFIVDAMGQQSWMDATDFEAQYTAATSSTSKP